MCVCVILLLIATCYNFFNLKYVEHNLEFSDNVIISLQNSHQHHKINGSLFPPCTLTFARLFSKILFLFMFSVIFRVNSNVTSLK